MQRISHQFSRHGGRHGCLDRPSNFLTMITRTDAFGVGRYFWNSEIYHKKETLKRKVFPE